MRLEKKYFYVGLSLVALIVINQMIIQYFLYQKSGDAKIINLAGRQRMLSQRVNLMAYRMFHSPENYSKDQLDKVLNDWEEGHLALMEGNAEIAISPVKIEEIAQKNRNAFQKIKTIRRLLSQSPIPDKGTIEVLNANRSDWLS